MFLHFSVGFEIQKQNHTKENLLGSLIEMLFFLYRKHKFHFCCNLPFEHNITDSQTRCELANCFWNLISCLSFQFKLLLLLFSPVHNCLTISHSFGFFKGCTGVSLLIVTKSFASLEWESIKFEILTHEFFIFWKSVKCRFSLKI